MACCICYEDIEGEGLAVTCYTHYYHAECVIIWTFSAGRYPRCPVCSAELLICDQSGLKSGSLFSQSLQSVHPLLTDTVEAHAPYINSNFLQNLSNSLECKCILFTTALLKLRYGGKNIRNFVTEGNLLETVTNALIENETEHEIFHSFASKFGLHIPLKLIVPFYKKYYLSIRNLAPDAYHDFFPALCRPVRELYLSLVGAPGPVFDRLDNEVLIPLSLVRDDFNTFYNQIMTSQKLKLAIKLSIKLKKMDFLELALVKHSQYITHPTERAISNIILKLHCKIWMRQAKFYDCEEIVKRWLPYIPGNTENVTNDLFSRLKMLPTINPNLVIR